MDFAMGFILITAVGFGAVALAVGGFVYARRPVSSLPILFESGRRGLVIQNLRRPDAVSGHAGVIWFFADGETARQLRGYGRVSLSGVDEQTGVRRYSLSVSQFVSFESAFAEISDLALSLCPHQVVPQTTQRREYA